MTRSHLRDAVANDQADTSPVAPRIVRLSVTSSPSVCLHGRAATTTSSAMMDTQTRPGSVCEIEAPTYDTPSGPPQDPSSGLRGHAQDRNPEPSPSRSRRFAGIGGGIESRTDSDIDSEPPVHGDSSSSHPETETSERGSADEPLGYITDPLGTAAQRAHIVGCLHEIEFDARVPEVAGPRFLAHVLHSASTEYDRWVPVGCRLIEKVCEVHTTEEVWRPLVDAGLIDFKQAISSQYLSREFRVVDEVYDEHMRLGLERPAERRVRLSTGISPRGQLRKIHKSYPGSKKPLPKLVYQARCILAANGCPYDGAAALAHVEAQGAIYEVARAVWDDAGRPEDGDLFDAFVQARGRYQHDSRCLGLMDAGAVTNVDVRRYRPEFARRPQMAGRITENGGIQNASRFMKHHVMSPLRGSHDVRNYDFSSSQPRILVHQFEEFGVDTAWLWTYLNGDKKAAAEQALGSCSSENVDLWKRCVMALVMGAALKCCIDDRLGRRAGESVGRVPAITEHILKLYPDREVAQIALDGLCAALGPLNDGLALWHRRMAASVASGLLRVGGRGGNFITNACGITLDTKPLSGWELTSALSAFFLQGTEASLVHHLTCLGSAYGYEPLSNQHDGLIVRGEIPNAAVEEAKALAGAPYAVLVEKRYHADLAIPGLDD